MDRMTMGGGVGISRGALPGVESERTTFAMPETGIGLFPDAGGGWYLARMPDHMLIWLALTGARIKAADCELVGVASDYVLSASLPQLGEAIIAEPAALEWLLTVFEGDPGRPTIAAHQDEIEKVFSLGSVEAIVAALEASQTDWAREQLAVNRSKPPQIVQVAFRELHLRRR